MKDGRTTTNRNGRESYRRDKKGGGTGFSLNTVNLPYKVSGYRESRLGFGTAFF